MRTTKITRTTKVTKTTKKYFCLLCVLCGSIVASGFMQASSPPLRSLDKGLQSGIDSPRQVTIRSREELTKLWKENGQNTPTSAVDFSKEMVVGVFMGSRPTAGFAIEIVGYRLAA